MLDHQLMELQQDLNIQQLLVKQHLLAMMTIQIIWLSMLRLLMFI